MVAAGAVYHLRRLSRVLAAVAVLVPGAALAMGTPGTGDTGAPVATGDTGLQETGLDLDSDGDGFTRRDGDCDDQEPLANPALTEVCEDRIDNDCDGYYDEECTQLYRQGTIQGGGGCTGGAGVGGVSVILLPLFGLGWWRRRS